MARFLLTESYSDDRGNRVIVNSNTVLKNVNVIVRGSNNIVIISDEIKELSDFKIDMPSEGGVLIIGNITGGAKARGGVRLGYNSFISIGDGVTCTKPFLLSAAEQVQILIGDDCMFATENHLRAEDAHAIYDVVSGKRLNISKDIVIGAHTWISYAAKIFGGSSICEGSIVGVNSIVKGKFPNNCTIAGAPAKIVRRNVAWERPTLFRSEPWIREDSSDIKVTKKYWNVTDDYNKTPDLGSGFIKNLSLLKKYKPDSIWLEKHKLLLPN